MQCWEEKVHLCGDRARIRKAQTLTETEARSFITLSKATLCANGPESNNDEGFFFFFLAT